MASRAEDVCLSAAGASAARVRWGHKMCRTALAVLLLCAPAPASAELTVSPAYADVRGGQPLLLTLPAGTRWDLEEPHCFIGAPRLR